MTIASKLYSPPIIILIRPQMGENIGAVARAMSNFGLCELRIVAPRDGWPNEKALEMAAGGKDIIQNATIYKNFELAMADINIAYATTARPRDMAKRVISPTEAIAEIIMKQSLKTALIFGPERTGLTNEEITLCDAIINIPTDIKNSSLNLAQSAVIIGYEWIKASSIALPIDSSQDNIACKSDMFSLFEQLENYLDKADYFRVPHKKNIMLQNIKNMLLRGAWSEQEIRSFRGMIRSLWERSK